MSAALAELETIMSQSNRLYDYLLNLYILSASKFEFVCKIYIKKMQKYRSWNFTFEAATNLVDRD